MPSNRSDTPRSWFSRFLRNSHERERVIGFKPRPHFPGPVDDRASIVP
jgi:hypothetical protein